MTTEYLLDKELDAVLGLLMPGNALVMRVAVHTGLRIGDILSIKTGDLKSHFWLTEQKTGKRRQVGLPEPLLSDIKAQAGIVFAFEGRKSGKARTRQAVWKDVKRAAVALRLPQNVAPHSARKMYAVDLLRKYGDIEKVRKALNHSSPYVTLLYALADMRMQNSQGRHRTKTGRYRV